MATQRKARRLLLASILALILTVGGAGALAYAWFSTRVVRWGDSLIIGPRFLGQASLDGDMTRLSASRLGPRRRLVSVTQFTRSDRRGSWGTIFPLTAGATSQSRMEVVGFVVYRLPKRRTRPQDYVAPTP